MTVFRSTMLLVFLLPGLSACSELMLVNRNPSSPADDSRQGAEFWFMNLRYTRDMTPEQQQQTLVHWERAFHNYSGSNNRMKLALLLATGDESIRDMRRARNLLKDIDITFMSSSDQELVFILQQLLDKEREEHRRVNILWKKNKEQDRQIEALEQQLRALTTIEQDIQQREKPVVIEDEK